MSPLHVQGFSGGVALVGAADTRGVDELLAADGYEIGPRGALVAASDVTPYVTVPLTALHALLTTSGIAFVDTIAVGEGTDGGGSRAYLLAAFPREGATSPVATTFPGAATAPAAGNTAGASVVPTLAGALVTHAVTQGPIAYATIPGDTPTQTTVLLVNIGAREGTSPRAAPGLYVVVCFGASAGIYALYPIQKFDALGTGPFGMLCTDIPDDPVGPIYGTRSQQLYFRGIVGYQGYVFGWGFDSADTVHGDGPCRVMFSNLGLPTTWGNDNIVASPPALPIPTPIHDDGDREFTDSDAIVFGGNGESVRAAVPVFGKLFFATNRGLHFLQGFGRSSFLTNGTIPVMQSYNVLGPHALIEGPDRLLYGVGDQGLWRYNGAGLPEPLFEKLVDFTGRSAGYWDCIWTDATRAGGVPGQTNGDLVWTAIDWARSQVLVGIPWCDAGTGAGYGTDTVLLKYHVRTGGFTRQVFVGVQYTAAGYFRRDNQASETHHLGTATPGQATVQRYGAGAVPVLPATPLVATFGPYAPFGPDGAGVVQRAYVTLAWSATGTAGSGSSSLPLVFLVATTIDEAPTDAFGLTVGPDAPTAPTEGDVWLDTSQTDTSLGNGRSGVSVVASGGYLAWTYSGTAWRRIPGQGGQGTRATVPLPLTRRTGSRVVFATVCTSAAGRYEIEGFGINPGDGTADA